MRGAPGGDASPARGDLVFLSSVAARNLVARSAPDTKSKVALEALALTLAMEERPHRIHANVVAPAWSTLRWVGA